MESPKFNWRLELKAIKEEILNRLDRWACREIFAKDQYVTLVELASDILKAHQKYKYSPRDGIEAHMIAKVLMKKYMIVQR